MKDCLAASLEQAEMNLDDIAQCKFNLSNLTDSKTPLTLEVALESILKDIKDIRSSHGGSCETEMRLAEQTVGELSGTRSNLKWMSIHVRT